MKILFNKKHKRCFELELRYENYLFGEETFDQTIEKTFDGEIVIADYLGDALRILKTECTPRIISKRKSEGKQTVDCVADIKIWYWSEDGKISVASKSESFTEEIGVKGISDAFYVRTSVCCDYSNGQIINSRKLSYKTVVSLSARLYKKREKKVVIPENFFGMEYLKKDVSVSSLVATAEKTIIVSDVIEVMQGKGEIKEIIKSSAVIATGDLKSINNKIITRGHADTKILYVSPENKIECVMAEIPFTQIIDIEGIDEDCVADLRYAVNSITASPKPDENGEMRQITVEMDVMAIARGYKNVEYQIASDAYSLCHSCKVETEKVSFESFLGHFNTVASFKESVEFTDSVIAVNDVSVTASVINVSRDGDKINVNCGVNCNVLAINQSREAVSVTRRFESVATVVSNFNAENMRMEPDIKISAVSFSISGDNRIDVKYEITLDCLIFSESTVNCIVSAQIDEKTKLERKNKSPLVIYFAKKGDDLFEIAKAYRTSKNAIIEANSLAEEIFSENKTIIIPIMKI